MAKPRANKKKSIEYHFVDVNDPDRYKKLKVARACDFCRKRKSKCDVGIPGSGTCSNCKKTKIPCIFSPVTTPPTIRKQIKLNKINKKPITPSSLEIKHDIFSLDSRGFCSFEKHTSFVYNHVTFIASMNDIPHHSQQFKQELFQVYLENVHPFYPVLDRFYILQSESLPLSLQWAIMSVALHFTGDRYEDATLLAPVYYYHASVQINHETSPELLLTVQTLLLLYKYQEIITPVGTPLSTVAIDYLVQAQSMLSSKPKEQGWSTADEFLCRTQWILFIIINMSSPADTRWKSLREHCVIPTRHPSLTESEQYDKGELNTACNLYHLVNITLLYSRTLSFVHQHDTFTKERPEFTEFATSLSLWRSNLPSQLAVSLTADPPNLYSAQNQSGSTGMVDTSRTASFTSYLCLIHDILDLIISLHQKNVPITKKALSVSYRAHSLTLGDMHPPGFSRLACIQGSRLMCFGLALAIQAQTKIAQQKESIEDTKKLQSVRSLSLQILEDIALSPELYLAIQTMRQEKETKKQAQIDYSQGPVMPDQDFYLTAPSSEVYSPSTPPLPPPQPTSSYPSIQPSQNYTMDTSSSSWPSYSQYGWTSSYQISSPHTSKVQQDFHSSQQEMYPFLEPVTPPVVALDSYFPPTSHGTNPTVAIASPNFSSVTLPIQNSKSCKHHQLL